MIAAVARARSRQLPNTTIRAGCKPLAGLGARRYAVIDVGTNSVKFHIAERRADGAWRPVVDRAEVTRLGEGLDETGGLQPEPIARTVDAIAAMVDEAQAIGVAAIARSARPGCGSRRTAPTSSPRCAAHAASTVEVISGEEEARLAYLAVKSGSASATGSLVVFDTGGGSSQFTFGDGDAVDERFSVNVGAVRFTERFGLDGGLGRGARRGAGGDRRRARRASTAARPDALVGMGGAVTNLAAVRHGLATYDPDVVQGTVLDRAEIDRQIELYRTRTPTSGARSSACSRSARR